MAITGSGFDGTMNEAQFAKLMHLAGARYAVGSTADFAATQVSGVRSISISAGDAYAPGVLVTSTAAEVMAFSAPTAGQSHLIVLRRTWSTNVCELVAIPGATTSTTTPTAPPTSYPTINSTPGVIDDQPLYWAWVNATTTAVTLFDVRNPRDTGWIDIELGSGWSAYAASETPAYRKLGGVVYFRGRASGPTGASATVSVIPAEFRPEMTIVGITEHSTSQAERYIVSAGGSVTAVVPSAFSFGGIAPYIAATA